MKLDSMYKRVDGRVGERGVLADLDAHLAEIRSSAWHVARDHAAADEDERLPPEDASHLLHDGPQHAQAGSRLALVKQRRVGDFLNKPRLADRLDRVAALARDNGVDGWPATPHELARQVDDLRRPEMELTHLGEVFLSDHRIERPQDRRMVCRGIELGPVRVGREADEVVG